ncbi:hypothetical protein UXO35_22070 [Enterobacter kobei]|uniref:hypothetical protein n=1 Tax=Enterobacter kobei TaxID=208224 RepID=UPI002075DA9D|nr:hypothetical protein [Enterobacter kobei]MCM7577559.1 hypothetical protein [Enterobacter kobei]MDX7584945.1 hypothetical protein [Enterobacter kobei]
MIFNGEMVRAILDGRKTQTRRIMKIQPSDGFHPTHNGYDLDLNAHWYTPGVVDKNGYLQPAKKDVFGVADENEGYTCPFGAVGDRIWVRETWAEAGAGAPDLKLYRANYPEHVPTHYENVPPADEIRWTPSIHMPRRACRLTLEITGVRVERLNGISETDAEAEGIDMEALFDAQDCYDCIADHNMTGRPTATGAFKYLWESIYGEESWKSNPWVWVIEFKVVPNVQANSTGSDLR